MNIHTQLGLRPRKESYRILWILRDPLGVFLQRLVTVQARRDELRLDHGWPVHGVQVLPAGFQGQAYHGSLPRPDVEGPPRTRCPVK